MRAKIITSIVGLVPLFSSGTASTAVPQPQTPAGHLARAAGALIGANEYLIEFAMTECAYVLKRKATPTKLLIEKEILPRFTADARQVAAATFTGMQSDLLAQRKHYVNLMISGAVDEYKGDRKTACGYVGGTLVGLFLGATDKWEAASAQ